jgi:hypothetical protein
MAGGLIAGGSMVGGLMAGGLLLASVWWLHINVLLYKPNKGEHILDHHIASRQAGVQNITCLVFNF